ncbi:hypothetical protein [Tsukamurella sp. 1534]|uniref:hypothetical protein n=1 Tax=Tsukamurella sp. 1534 TaxID=1151061 RepID=UPI000316E0E8|nr:hypothetical protein [Tsukamurella sp. 1534]
MVDVHEVEVRLVRETLASPLAIAFATEDEVVLVTPIDAADLHPEDDRIVLDELTIDGPVEQLEGLLAEARCAAGREYVELGDLDIVRVGGEVQLQRRPGVVLTGTSPLVLAGIVERERAGWINREVDYARWTFPCGDNQFVTSPLRAKFVAKELAAALG